MIGHLQLSDFIDSISAVLPAISHNDRVIDLCPPLHLRGGESSTGLTPLFELVSLREGHESLSKADNRDLLNEVVESFRYQVTKTINELDAESYNRFVSGVADLCKLPTADFVKIISATALAADIPDPQPLPTSLVKPPSANPNYKTDYKRGDMITGTVRSIWEKRLETFKTGAVRALVQLVKNHWDELAVESEVRGQSLTSDKQTRRIHHYLELQQLKKKAELHWFRRALALIRTLDDFDEFLQENDHLSSYTPKQKFREAFLRIYAGISSDIDMPKARESLRQDLQYARRWKIFVEVLGNGALLVCGENIAKLVYVLSLVTR
jgi:hypothetical protein